MDNLNIHNVRKMKYVTVPTGKPEFVYYNPEDFGARDVSQQLNIDVLDHCTLLYASYTQVPDCYGCDEDVVKYFLTLMLQNGWVLPCNIDEALALFGDLLIEQEQINAL